jgi:hypothetical protein
MTRHFLLIVNPHLEVKRLNINCPNCFILKEQFQLALQEFESGKTIISLLRGDNISTSVSPVTHRPMPSVITADSHYLVDINWIPVKHKVNKKKISPYNTAWKAEMRPYQQITSHHWITSK